MRVSIVGSGYVGVVTAAGLAAKGHQVTCVDSDAAKVAGIRRGVPAFHEPGLEEMLRRNGARLAATVNLHQAVLESDVSLIAVGTPLVNGAIDLAAVRSAAAQIGAALREKRDYHLVVVKSTVVPGTTEDVVGPLIEQTSGKQAGPGFGLAANPEFLTEGEAVRDFMHPDRLVLGALDADSMTGMEELYASFEGGERVRTNPRTAEMIKYASNCLLATAISFSNEIANLCAALGGIDVVEVMRGVHASRYLTATAGEGQGRRAELAAFLWAGCGFGGSCLPKDLRALIEHGRVAGQPMTLLQAVAEVNQQQPRQVMALLHKHFPSLHGVRIAVLGLAFRPGTSDMRESPALLIIHQLLAEGASVSAYDPAAHAEAARVLADRVHVCDDLDTAVAEAEAVVLVTRWEEFRGLPDALKATGRNPLLVDGRRMLERTAYGRYEGIGL